MTDMSIRSLRPRSRSGRIALVVLLSVGALVWAFDWNWCRPLIRHYVMSHSGRSFEFDDLHVRFDRSFDPTVDFRGLTIQNAPWASDQRPLIRAGRFAATVSWRSLWSDQTVVSLIVLEDAQVDMERQADGLRNWRLGHPDDRGPPKVKLIALDASRSRLHTVHGGIGLEADAQISPLPRAEPIAGRPDLPLTKRLVFKGTYQGKAFEGDTAVSDVLSFGVGPQRFSLRGTGRLGGWRLDAEGLASDVHGLADVDLAVRLRSEGAGSLWPLPDALARLRPLVANGHVSKTGTSWTASGLQVRAGRRSELAGDLDMVSRTQADAPRRSVRASLRDVVVDIDDIALLRGKAAGAAKAAAPTASGATAHAISADPLDLAGLRDFDADVDLKNARFTGFERDLAQSLRAHATLANGILQVRTFDLGVADGHVSGTLQVDASRSPSAVALDLTAHALRLDRLSQALSTNNSLIASIDGRATLRSQGDSLHGLALAAKGSLDASLSPGASVSKRLDAKLSLDGGAWLRSLFDKSARVPVECAALSMAIDHGAGTSRRFVFETEHTALAGHASVSLANESIDATVMPVRKERAVLVLDKAIHAEGPWREIKVRLVPPLADAAPQRCATERARVEALSSAPVAAHR
jgi:uncharacterized protein involved in outer membrane biogenesis